MKMPYCKSYISSRQRLMLLASLYLSAQFPALRAETAIPPFHLQAETKPLQPDQPIEMYDHGVMYINGDGVKPDAAAGRYWITRAARLGYPLAQYSLGVIFQEGIGGERNIECAQLWFRVAAQAQGEVSERAQQAILSLGTEAQHLPKVYRPLRAEACGQLSDMAPVVEPSLPTDSLVTDIPEVASGDNHDGGSDAFPSAPVVGSEPLSSDPDTAGESVPVKTPDDNHGVENAPLRPLNRQVTEEAPVTDIPELASGDNHDGGPDAFPSAPVVGSEPLSSTPDTAGESVPAQTLSDDNDGIETAPLRPLNRQATDEARIATPQNTPPETKASSEVQGPAASVLPESPVGMSIDKPEGQSPKAPIAIQKPKADIPPVTSTLPIGEKTPSVANTATAPVYNLRGNIQTAPGTHYTLQLSSDRQPDDLYQVARRHRLTNYQVYETLRHGQRWYVLVYGEYKTVGDAKQAIRFMPKALQAKGPWVRHLSQVQQELQGIPAY